MSEWLDSYRAALYTIMIAAAWAIERIYELVSEWIRERMWRK